MMDFPLASADLPRILLNSSNCSGEAPGPRGKEKDTIRGTVVSASCRFFSGEAVGWVFFSGVFLSCAQVLPLNRKMAVRNNGSNASCIQVIRVGLEDLVIMVNLFLVMK